jgi:hypothetical protein
MGLCLFFLHDGFQIWVYRACVAAKKEGVANRLTAQRCIKSWVCSRALIGRLERKGSNNGNRLATPATYVYELA